MNLNGTLCRFFFTKQNGCGIICREVSKMVIHDNVLFYNAEELIPTKSGGMMISRYKDDVRLKMNERARRIALFGDGCELRFVTSANFVLLKLKATLSGRSVFSGKAKATVFFGDFYEKTVEISEGAETTIIIEPPKPLMEMPEEFFEGSLFSKNVIRIYLSDGQFEYCGIETYGEEIRPPKVYEMPEKTILSVGSSISHGLISMDNNQCYVKTFARLMEMDVLVKGLSGSCLIEKEVADHFAETDNWDYALLELATNAFALLETEEFKNRFHYFAEKLYQTGKKLIFVTIPLISTYYADKTRPGFKKLMELNKIVTDKCAQYDPERVFIVEGTDLVPKTNYLTIDMVHPSTAGHIDMGYNLYNMMKDWLK